MIALYSAFRDEADLFKGLSRLILVGCQVIYPRVKKQQKQMTFHKVNHLTDLEAGSYGILESNVGRCPAVLAEDIDVIVVPGLSFTRTGLRLGYGGGFYDRMFSCSSVRALLVGVGFSLQVAEELPAEEHDVRMQYLLTEEGLEACGVPL
ncbi:5-formyltetrahydrofolate cyclo-ligase [Alicyclobacillus fastidiosus]|uniref:5-formyltetrahydrofolate cyclo-ligase n=1 Tax=Alicyclobacillus fastidiosus TaxID=392011 RepID=A0ABY6ZCX8_9BACL|nr:5-formyltetrahydrofolate cyclo-ligase [Alicyclobacillus fastidiosus]WAH40692.1 5-formyltetrahydrofolate cyclo-ligase [Alicyclobacillus fastidiosus]GMA62162.1 hypothetical protein GCM10025859_26020 [Alicyclobacillus fastidiosus]